MENNPEISIVIPAYNEEKRLPSTLEKCFGFLLANRYSFEVIVVDDGSQDNTSPLVKKYQCRWPNLYLMHNDIKRGKGFSVRRGMLHANGKYIYFSDADLSTPIEELEKSIAYLRNGYDVVFGSRAMSASQVIVREAWYRDRMGKIFGFIVRNLALPGIRDSQCGFKGFQRNAAINIFRRQTVEGFAFDVEVLFIGRRLGLRMAEVPVSWKDSPQSKVNPIFDSFNMLIELIRIRMNNILGRYSF